MTDPEYLAVISKFGKSVKHILDCPQSNFPVLSKSKATFYTDKLKMVCPLMFPTSYAKGDSLSEEYKYLVEKAASNMPKVDGLDLYPSFNGLEHEIYPLKSGQKVPAPPKKEETDKQDR